MAPRTVSIRANEVASGIARGVIARVIRFGLSAVMARVFVRTFGLRELGWFGVVAAISELVAMSDFAWNELCVFEASHADDEPSLVARIGQASWLGAVPMVLGGAALAFLGLSTVGMDWIGGDADRATLRSGLLASAIGHPFLMLGNAQLGVLQGLGHLRRVARMHVVSALLDTGTIIAALLVGVPPIALLWVRSAGFAVRVVWFALELRGAGLPLLRPRKPEAARLRSMVAYCAGYSVSKALGSAMYRTTIPLASLVTGAVSIGAYDASDRFAGAVHRLANPVWDAFFPRIVRGASGGADHEARRTARDAFLTGTHLLAFGALSYAGVLVLLGRPLLEAWLGREPGARAAHFLAFTLAAWCLNMMGSMSTAVLLASKRAVLSNLVHGCALAVQVLGFVAFGSVLGERAMTLGPILANLVLATGLGMAACPIVGVARGRWLRTSAVLLLPAALAWFASRHVDGLAARFALAALHGAVMATLTLGMSTTLRDGLARRVAALRGG